MALEQDGQTNLRSLPSREGLYTDVGLLRSNIYQGHQPSTISGFLLDLSIDFAAD